jgi:succinate dehydrogenase subunit D
MKGPHTTGHRRDLFWIAAMVHRASGVLLACFLPLHFLVLGLAIEQTAKLDGFLKWTEQPAVKFAEVGLVFLLAVHLLGGLRVLMIENFTWRVGQKQIAAAVVSTAGLVAILFFLRVL